MARTQMHLVDYFMLILVLLSWTCVAVKSPVSGVPDENEVHLAKDVEVGLNGKLIFSHVIFRHGDRTPYSPYANDPWGKREFWPTGFGQLTNIGKGQHYRLGQWLRKRYNDLLSPIYSKDEIYVQSTDVDRTLMSALSNLAGLYQPQGADIWDPAIAWQPIPVHTVPETLDSVLAGKAPCPAYDYALSALQNSPEFQKLNKRYDYLYQYLTKYAGEEVNSLQSVQYLNNTLFIEDLYNKTLPEWTRKVYPSADMTQISNLAFAMYTYTRRLARLRSGPLVKEILDRFTQKTEGKLDPDRKVWIYSAHDSTVASTLNALKLFDLHSPPYTACILLELRQDEQNNHFVSIFYKNTTAEPLPMEIPNCGIACPLDSMIALYNDILPDDWKSECRLPTMLMAYEEANMTMALGVLLTVITVMLILSYMVMVYHRRRNYRTYYSYSQVA